MFPLMARTVDGDKLATNRPVRHPRHQDFSVCSPLPFSKKKALGTNLTIRMHAKAPNYFTFTNHANKDKRQISHTCLESSLESTTGYKTLLMSVIQNCCERTIKSNTNIIVKILPLLVPVASKIA